MIISKEKPEKAGVKPWSKTFFKWLPFTCAAWGDTQWMCFAQKREVNTPETYYSNDFHCELYTGEIKTTIQYRRIYAR